MKWIDWKNRLIGMGIIENYQIDLNSLESIQWTEMTDLILHEMVMI